MGIVHGFPWSLYIYKKNALENMKRGKKIRPLNCKIPVNVFAVEPE